MNNSDEHKALAQKTERMLLTTKAGERGNGKNYLFETIFHPLDGKAYPYVANH